MGLPTDAGDGIEGGPRHDPAAATGVLDPFFTDLPGAVLLGSLLSRLTGQEEGFEAAALVWRRNAMWQRVMALVISVGLGAGVTGPKLYKMAQIKGWQPGAMVTTGVITDKGVNHGRYGQYYWVSWAEHGGARTRDGRDNVTSVDWESTRVGDRVEVVRVPGDDSAYLRNGVFVETGNFVFDFVLLTAEIITALVMVVLLFRSRRGRTPGRRGT